MGGELKGLSLHGVRRLTVVVLIAVAAAIALANLSSEPVSGDLIKNIANGPHRAFGWPLTWYWRIASTVPGPIQPGPPLPPRALLQWPIERYNASRLVADLAIWLLVLAGAAAACQRLLRKYHSRRHWRPRVVTLIVLLAITTPIVLANMTFVVSPMQLYEPGGTAKASFGWPLLWHWYLVAPFDNVYGWDFSAARLAGNVTIWLVTLALAALLWEWLLRRYRPRLRFSLQTMLAAVAIVSFLCAWCVMVRRRADDQDALVAHDGLAAHQVWVKRWGPKWLGLVLPDRFRRCVMGCSISVGRPTWADEEEQRRALRAPFFGAKDDGEDPQDREEPNSVIDDEESDTYDEGAADDVIQQEEEVLKRLSRLSALRFLSIHCGWLTPAMVKALADLRQLRMLQLAMRRPDGWGDRPTDLAWLGKLHELEQLSLAGVRGDDLAYLTGLTHLKSLTLDLTDCEGDEPEMDKRLAAIAKLTQLRRLRVQGSPGVQIAHLRGLTNLESLALDFDRFHGDDERSRRECFAALGTMTQIEHLQLESLRGALRVRANEVEYLRGLTNLKSLTLQISCPEEESHRCLAALSNLTQLRRLWLPGKLVSGGLAELAPLESLEELVSDYDMATPAAIESLAALKNLRAVSVFGLDLALASSTAEADDLRRAVESLRQSHPEIVVSNSQSRWLADQTEQYQNELVPWFRWQPFDRNSTGFASDLDYFLQFVPAAGP